MNEKDLLLNHMFSKQSRNPDSIFSPGILKENIFPNHNTDEVEFLIREIIQARPELIKTEKIVGYPFTISATGMVKSFLENGGFSKIETDIEEERKRKVERDLKQDQIMDLDLQLKRFESKIGKKLLIAGSIIAFLSFLVTVLTLKFWEKTDNNKNSIIKLTEIENGRWISETDSLSGIEIKNGKWILFYKGEPTEQTDIYEFTVTNELPKYANTQLKSGEFLILTNESDTLNYEILGYENEFLSLMYFPKGNILTYRKE